MLQFNPTISAYRAPHSAPPTPAATLDPAPEGAQKTRPPPTSDAPPPRPAAVHAPAELEQIHALQARDREVRQHERAHASAAAGIAHSAPSYTYTRGPDGQQYAVGGEVQIDTSAVAGDPEATLRKATQIQRAALAPAQPSSQDRAVAAQAAAMAATARAELLQLKAAEAQATRADGAPRASSDTRHADGRSAEQISAAYAATSGDDPNSGNARHQGLDIHI